MVRRGDPRGIHDRRPRARSASPPPADGGARATSQAVRRSAAAEVSEPSVRGCSVPPRRGDGGVSSRPHLQNLRVVSLMEHPPSRTVHPQLPLQLSRAMARMNMAACVDDAVLEEFLQAICDALLDAGFRTHMVSELRSNIKTSVPLSASGSKSSIRQALLRQLYRLLDSGKRPDFVPKKGKPCVVLVIGLQGSGKTTSSAKFAYYHQKKGHNPSLICADTRNGHAFDRLKQIAGEANIPCFGSYTELDPVKIAAQGVEKLTTGNSDLIIIDAGGSYMLDDAFLSEVRKINKSTKPDLIILVVHAGVGRSAFDQAQILRTNVSIGSAIVTRMDEHSTGGGVLNALAAARLPVILLGTGKRIQDYQTFDVKLFSNNLLDHKNRSIQIDTEDMYMLFDTLKVSDAERRSAIVEVEEECQSAYNGVLEKHRLLAQDISHLHSNFRRLCDVLGEEDLKNVDIQSATTLEERHRLMLRSIKLLEKETNTRKKKLQVLLSKALALWDSLGVTSNEQRNYKYMLENFSLSVQEANSLSTKSLKKLESKIEEMELKIAGKADEFSDKKIAMDMHLQRADQSKDYILRHSQMFISRGTDDRADLSVLRELIEMTYSWQLKYQQTIPYQQNGLLVHLQMAEVRLLRLNSDTSGHGDSNNNDTEMGHSASSRSDTEMGTSSSGTGSSDPDYSPESVESDI